MKYIQNHQKMGGCVFCHAQKMEDGPENLIVCRGRLAFLILNRFPYTTGHLMAVPNVHSPSLDLLQPEVRAEMMELAARAVTVLTRVYHPDGFNLGINIGSAAGAGIAEHLHFHVLPRWGGDTNFMASVADTRVLPETLEDSYRRVKEAWLAHSD
ncbi:MAG TPA: HIT domain-containing protein [Anaerolineaceae bacterium]|nr:HIT domain-containing protein [Anaerolineaceae bacterium]